MERGLMMLLHAILIGVVFYVIMVHGLHQPARIAENRSILFAAAIAIYMILFGHGLPTHMNPIL
jgi:hypothetical protein